MEQSQVQKDPFKMLTSTKLTFPIHTTAASPEQIN